MGARFDYYCVDEMPQDELLEHHEEVQCERIGEFGNGTYAGHIGIAEPGLTCCTHIVFTSGDDAKERLEQSCSKWGSARYVYFTQDGGPKRIMVGAWCAN
jgi:hypothetical protein